MYQNNVLLGPNEHTLFSSTGTSAFQLFENRMPNTPAVPEPATATLLAAGAAVLLLMRLRSQRR